MDINLIMDEIKLKCRLNNRKDIEIEIQRRIGAGSTGSEINAMVGKYLHDLRNTDQKVYELIKKDIELYLEYCRAQGIIIR